MVLGIGFLAWGRWQGAGAGRVIQFLCILTAFSLESRASLLSFIFCLVLALWRESSWFPPPKALLFAIAGIVGASLLPNLPSYVSTLHQLVNSYTETINSVLLPPPDQHKSHDETVGTAQRDIDHSKKLVEKDSLLSDIARQGDQELPATHYEPEVKKKDENTLSEDAHITEENRDTRFTLELPALEMQLDQLDGGGTGGARLLTWRQILEAFPRDHLWLLGGGLGSDILYRICSAGGGPTNSGYPGGGLGRPKCHVDSNEAPTVLRDPHNWLLNLMLYHGLIGTLIFILAIAIPMVVYRRTPCSSLAIIPIGAYFVSGSFGVILSAPFGMLPVAVFLGWLLREGLAPGRPPTEQVTQGRHV